MQKRYQSNFGKKKKEKSNAECRCKAEIRNNHKYADNKSSQVMNQIERQKHKIIIKKTSKGAFPSDGFLANPNPRP